jgi:hypothetical protein
MAAGALWSAAGYFLLSQGEVVGGGFAGDVEALSLRGADGGEGTRGGDVLDVQVGAQLLGYFYVAEELEVALDDAGFGFDGHAAEAEAEGEGAGVHAAASGEAGVFGVLRDGEAQAGGGYEGGAHDGVFEDGLAIVGEAYGSGFG